MNTITETVRHTSDNWHGVDVVTYTWSSDRLIAELLLMAQESCRCIVRVDDALILESDTERDTFDLLPGHDIDMDQLIESCQLLRVGLLIDGEYLT